MKRKINLLLTFLMFILSYSQSTQPYEKQEWIDYQQRHSNDMFNTALVPIKSKDKWKLLVTKLQVPDNIYFDYGSPKTLIEINSAVNKRIAYKTELHDYWKTPEETVSDGFGDCEDQAILKMALMIKAGYNPNDIYMVVGADQIARRDHALIAYKTAHGEYLVLDNHRDSIFKDKEYVSFFRPILSYTINKTYLHGTRS